MASYSGSDRNVSPSMLDWSERLPAAEAKKAGSARYIIYIYIYIIYIYIYMKGKQEENLCALQIFLCLLLSRGVQYVHWVMHNSSWSKVTFGKFLTKSENFSKIGGKSETGG